jgi:hypothetical protein
MGFILVIKKEKIMQVNNVNTQSFGGRLLLGATENVNGKIRNILIPATHENISVFFEEVIRRSKVNECVFVNGIDNFGKFLEKSVDNPHIVLSHGLNSKMIKMQALKGNSLKRSLAYQQIIIHPEGVVKTIKHGYDRLLSELGKHRKHFIPSIAI